MTGALDPLDRRLVRALHDSPRAGVMELARRLGVARGTIQARMDRLVARGVVSFVPHVDPPAMGYAVLAFATLEIAQGRIDPVVSHLRSIPEVLEAHVTTGQSDLHCRLVARTNEHLEQVLHRILEAKGITRTTTVIALSDKIPYRVLPLVEAGDTTPGHGGR